MEEARAPMLWGDEQDMDLLAFYRDLIKLRRDHPALWRGQRQTVFLDAAAGTLAYLRADEEEQLLIALNASDERRTLKVAGLELLLTPWSGTVVPIPR
jgi:glycosidase